MPKCTGTEGAARIATVQQLLRVKRPELEGKGTECRESKDPGKRLLPKGGGRRHAMRERHYAMDHPPLQEGA